MIGVSGALIIALLVATIFGWLGARLVIALAARVGLQDAPNPRSSHTVPLPRGGGIGIVAGAVIGTLVFRVLAQDCANAPPTAGCESPADPGIWIGLAATSALALVGLADDFLNLSRRARLSAQTLAALAVMFATGAQLAFPLALLALLLLVGVWWINLFNFMDGIDGLAAMQAIFMLAAGLLFGSGALVDLDLDLDLVTVHGLLLLGATLGFIGLNWAPARVFMGDVGSLFLGVSTLFVAMHGVTRGYTSPWFWLIVAGMFVADATTTLLKRLMRGDDVTSAHRSHLYQRLARRWGSHAKVTLVYFALNVSWFLPLALVARHFPAWGAGFAMLAYLPVIGVCLKLGAGEPDHPTGSNNNSKR